jgi:Lon protease-like protein
MATNTKYRPGKEKDIAFFPLNIFIYPGEKVPLRIFEPRYIELISHVEITGEPFAIPFLLQAEVTSLGTIVKLNKIVNKYPNGEMTILIEGVQFCEIIDYYPTLPERLYGGGKVVPFPTQFYSTNRILLYYLHLLDWDKDPTILITNEIADIFAILHKLQLTNLEKYTILLQKNKTKLEMLVISYLKYYQMLYLQEKLLNNNFDLN